MTTTEKSKIQRAIDHIAAHPGCRRDDLAKIMDVVPEKVQPALHEAIRSGLVVACKVDRPGKPPTNEYRLSSSAPARPDWKEWKAAHPASTARPLKPPKNAGPGASTATGKPTTPAGGGDITPAASDRSAPLQTSPTEAEAVVEPPAPAPKPARARSDEITLQIDNDACLLIDTADGVIELEPAQTRLLGEFLTRCTGLWGPA